jgi:carbon monoxide dehydrogenase subunit G
MATIIRDVSITAPAAAVWDAIADYGAVHERVCPGFVVDTRLVEGGRVVTFANGMVATETLVTADHDARRLVYAVTASERLTHHSASFQVLADGAGSRVVWTADILPDAMAEAIGAMMSQGADAMRRHLSR